MLRHKQYIIITGTNGQINAINKYTTAVSNVSNKAATNTIPRTTKPTARDTILSSNALNLSPSDLSEYVIIRFHGANKVLSRIVIEKARAIPEARDFISTNALIQPGPYHHFIKIIIID